MKGRILIVVFLVGLSSLAESHYGHHDYHHGHHHDRNCGHTTTTARPTTTTTTPTTKPTAAPSPVETKSLNDLYQESLKEGGRVIVYAGGDTIDQLDYMKTAYEQQFPGTTLDIIVDYSKFHNARIDTQLANNNLIPDVAQLQTLQDFPRWKKEGVLLQYKPLGWDQVFDSVKDSEGYYTAAFFAHFTNVFSKKVLSDNSTWPTEARDYLRPEFKGKLVVTYPNDDDAVLFWFKQVVDKYGWGYVQDFAQQNPILVRGTQEPYDAAEQGRTPATPSAWSGLSNSVDYPTAVLLPKNDPFVVWPQTAAIFKNATRPAGAKLYMSWLLDFERQTAAPMDEWSVRKDAPLPKDLSTGQTYKSIFNYPGQADPLAFGRWMADRQAVELFRSQISLILGEVKGEPSPGHPGLYPEKALPH